MLTDLFIDLIKAENEKERERAFKRLEKVGIDRATARYVASRMDEEFARKEKEYGFVPC